MMPKSPKFASFPRVTCPARARPIAHRMGRRTSDLHLSAQRGTRSGLHMGREIWGRQLTTRGAEIGVPKGSHFGCSKRAKIRGILNGISPRRIRDQICHSICHQLGVQQGLTCLWLSKISMPLGVVTIETRSTIAKIAKSVVLVDRPRWETLAILTRQAMIHNS